MDLYAPICRNLVGPLWARKERSPYLRHLRDIEKSQYKPLEEIRLEQLIRLKLILKHAWENTEFYKQRWRKIGFKPEDLKVLDELKHLPILTKEDIRTNQARMVAKNIPSKNLIPRKTSGSTGISLEFFVDNDSMQWKRACTLHHDHWSGWRFGEKIAAIWGNPTHRVNWRSRVRNALLERYDYLDTLNMGEADMLSFYKRQVRRKPTLLFGHAHSICLFARFLKANGLEPFKLKGIISTCMVLHDYERSAIEEVFDCIVTNRYGSEEVSLIACECEANNGLHLNLASLHVEFINNGKAASEGEPGAIVVTDLTNYGMPFIRYKVGDVATPSDRVCSCGRSTPLIETIEGRVADYVITQDGKLISGISLTENFALLLPEIKQLQIIQEKVNYFTLKIVKSHSFDSSSEEKITSLVRQKFGRNVKHQIQYVNQIPQELSGKYRFCISKVINPFH